MIHGEFWVCAFTLSGFLAASVRVGEHLIVGKLGASIKVLDKASLQELVKDNVTVHYGTVKASYGLYIPTGYVHRASS